VRPNYPVSGGETPKRTGINRDRGKSRQLSDEDPPSDVHGARPEHQLFARSHGLSAVIPLDAAVMPARCGQMLRGGKNQPKKRTGQVRPVRSVSALLLVVNSYVASSSLPD
jgi:hypothetical protein